MAAKGKRKREREKRVWLGNELLRNKQRGKGTDKMSKRPANEQKNKNEPKRVIGNR